MSQGPGRQQMNVSLFKTNEEHAAHYLDKVLPVLKRDLSECNFRPFIKMEILKRGLSSIPTISVSTEDEDDVFPVTDAIYLLWREYPEFNHYAVTVGQGLHYQEPESHYHNDPYQGDETDDANGSEKEEEDEVYSYYYNDQGVQTDPIDCKKNQSEEESDACEKVEIDEVKEAEWLERHERGCDIS